MLDPPDVNDRYADLPRLLAEIAAVTGNRSLALESEALRATLEARRDAAALFSGRALGRLGASPLDTRLVTMAGDHGLAPVDRWAAIAAIEGGACWNPSELRTGISPLRLEALAQAAERASDIARTGQWAEEERHRLERLQTGGSLTIEGPAWSFAWLTPIRRSLWCSGVRAGGVAGAGVP